MQILKKIELAATLESIRSRVLHPGLSLKATAPVLINARLDLTIQNCDLHKDTAFVPFRQTLHSKTKTTFQSSGGQ